MAVFKGQLEIIRYEKDDFKILLIRIDKRKVENKGMKTDKRGLVTIVGEIPNLDFGLEYCFEVDEGTYNQKFGYQYKFKNSYIPKPNDLESVKNYLVQVGVTDRQADTILGVYPDIIERVVGGQEVDLTLLKGIKEERYKKIKDKITENFVFMDVIREFKEYDLNLSRIKRIYNRYNKNISKLRKALEEEPYKCLCSISGIGFLTADGKILKAKPEMIDSNERCTSCVEYLIKKNEEDESSTYIELDKLRTNCIEFTRECSHHFDTVIYFNEDIVLKDNKVFLKRTYEAEKYIAERMWEGLSIDKRVYNIDVEKYRITEGRKATDQQIQGAINLCNENISIISGYSGTGKSTSMKMMLNMLDDNKLEYVLFAPTGRASCVVSNYTGKSASTIHRGLGYGKNYITGEFEFSFNKNNKIDTDVLFIDESSMIDIFLFKAVLEAIDFNRTKLVLILDPEQLASVGVGKVGFDLIESGLIPMTFLTEVFRYAEGGLSMVATNTREGKKFLNNDLQGIVSFGKNKDYSLISVNEESYISYILMIYETLLSKGEDINDIIVLSALTKGEFGTFNINNVIQSKVNPINSNKKEIKINDNLIFREGDRVIQTKNNYRCIDFNTKEEVAVFNGNIGTILEIRLKHMVVEFEDNTVILDRGEINNLLLGYCITIHKSQGSQFKYVLCVTPSQHTFFLTKNLLYVALTRASYMLYHITKPNIVNSSLHKKETNKRKTYLQNFLKIMVDK